MKLTMDESLKHRVVGIAVIVSIAVIFLPAMIKKNNQRLEEKKIVVELPAKPPQPQLAEVDESTVFAETKVAHVDLDTQTIITETQQEIDKNPISDPQPIHHEDHVSTTDKPAPHPVKANLTNTDSNLVKIPTIDAPRIKTSQAIQTQAVPKSKKTASKLSANSTKWQYTVQVGVFSLPSNAQLLQERFSKKGYQTRLVKTEVRGKPGYKLLVGNVTSAQAAQHLKLAISQQHHIQGFVTKGVG